MSNTPKTATKPLAAAVVLVGYALEVLDGPAAGLRIPITEFPQTIGRETSEPLADVLLPADPELQLSRLQLRVHYDAAQSTCVVEDMNSSNGTTLDGYALDPGRLYPVTTASDLKLAGVYHLALSSPTLSEVTRTHLRKIA